MAFHDDLYVVCRPECVVQVFSILRAGVVAARQDPDSPGKDPSLESAGPRRLKTLSLLQQAAHTVDPDACGVATRTFPQKIKSFSGPRWGPPIWAFAIEVGFPPHSVESESP